MSEFDDDKALVAVVKTLVSTLGGKIASDGILQAKESPDFSDIVYVDWIDLITNDKYEFEVMVTPIA